MRIIETQIPRAESSSAIYRQCRPAATSGAQATANALVVWFHRQRLGARAGSLGLKDSGNAGITLTF